MGEGWRDAPAQLGKRDLGGKALFAAGALSNVPERHGSVVSHGRGPV
jgi:hypothetical protein